MKYTALLVAIMSSGLLAAQEEKKVPKDSVRVSIPGCTKGYVFTVGTRTADQPGTVNIPEGMHLRMAGPKQLMAEIKAHENSMIEITGLMKRGQYGQEGIAVGKGVRVTPGVGPGGASVSASSVSGPQTIIDVEGWRPAVGDCPSR